MMRSSNPKPSRCCGNRGRTLYRSRPAKAVPARNDWRFRPVRSLRFLATIAAVAVSVSVVSASAPPLPFSFSSIGAAARSRNSFRNSLDTNLSKSSEGVPCDGRPVVPKHRKACGFYVWDVPSALLYKWCHSLLKDRIYEGRGGYLFVRYENNSILKLLYPCSRYSPNKCLICGGSYSDHLELWWSKHLYSPYDRYLDKTYNEALVIDEESGEEHQASSGTNTKKRRNRNRNRNNNHNHNHNHSKKHSAAARKSSRPTNRGFVSRGRNNRTVHNRNNRSSSQANASANKIQTFSDPPAFHFHKRYVKDVSEMIRGMRDQKNTRNMEAIRGIRYRNDMREVVRKQLPASKQNIMLIPCRDVMYVMPGIGGYGVDTNRTVTNDERKRYTRKDFVVDVLSLLVQSVIDQTIYFQSYEFEVRKQKNSRASNRL